jgi:nucleoside-diphosphate-sugar epimerase
VPNQSPDFPRVAITGATGFVGSVVVRRMAALDYKPRLLLRRSAPELEALASEVVRGDLRDHGALSALAEEADVIIHIGGLVAAARREEFHAVNAEATAALVAAARASGTSRFLLLSSLAAREPTLSPYAASKRAAERALQEGAGDLTYAILRPPGVYGPGDRATLPIFQQLASGVVAVPGKRGARFSLIHVEDLARAIAALVQHPEAPAWDGVPLPLDDGEAEGYGWEDLARIAGEGLGRSIRVLRIPPHLLAPIGFGGSLWGRLSRRPVMLSSGKLRELSWPDWVARAQPEQLPPEGRPRVKFAEGFTSTLEWYEKQGWLKPRRAAV